MDVARGQKFVSTRLEPTVASAGLTLGAVPVPAAIVGDSRTVAAVDALIEMPAQGGGATARNTLRCCPVIHLRLRSRKVRPAARTRSATSSGGRFIIGSAVPCLSVA